MAEVDHQMLLTRKKEDMNQQFLDVGTIIKQREVDIKEEMEKHSREALSNVCATEVDAQLHNIQHHRCYGWLRGAMRENIEHKRFKVCAPAFEPWSEIGS